MNDVPSTKVKDLSAPGGSAFQRYRALCYGPAGTGYVLRSELLTALIGDMPGAAGLFLRSKLYPRLFASCGRRVMFGRGLVLRHARKISLGDGTILDDHTVLDAKGTTNEGITLGERVYIGRNTIVYCKNGNIRLGAHVNISSNCQVFSCNDLEIGADTVIGAFSYLLSGGEYDPSDATPFSAQSGMNSRAPLRVGPGCWLGARVTVLDGCRLGTRCVVGAGAVVTKDLPDGAVALGVPARVVRCLDVPPSQEEQVT